MSALDAIYNILNTSLSKSSLRYCLVDDKKIPYKVDGTLAKPNENDDFVNLETLLLCTTLESYAGVGISVQASKICAVDVDKCFSKPFDFESIDLRGKEIFESFKPFSYCEFSFSGTGLRILFKLPVIDNYSDTYYIKNEKNQIEYYQPTNSYRYVTITGKAISDNGVDCSSDKMEILIDFLNKFMKKPERKSIKMDIVEETRTIEELKAVVKKLYLKNFVFQEMWFAKAPGSHSDESEKDYKLLSYLYENVTQDKEMIKQLFESSNYFHTKDFKHIKKWTNNEFRYYNYVYEQIRRSHS